MKRVLILLSAPAIVAGFLMAERYLARADAAQVLDRSVTADHRNSLVVLSETFTLDRIYKSMQGPYGTHDGLKLAKDEESGLLWVTGIRTEVVDRDGESAISPEFFCHANLTLSETANSPEQHNALLGDRTHLDWRLFTLVPGRLVITLPEGFGIPVHARESFDYLSMSLNQNVPDQTVEVRFRTTVDFVKDRDVEREMKPLFRRAVYGYEPLAGTIDPVLCKDAVHPGEGCGPFLGEAASGKGFVESLGEQNTIHWMVPPGRYESRTVVTDQLMLPFETTVHYVTAHLHPYGVSLTLIDLTSGETLFEIQSTDFEDRLGVATMGEMSFPEGVTLHADHEYELVTIYDNRASENIDAMAIMYLYLLDRNPGGPVIGAS
jgi:hypothetical protein